MERPTTPEPPSGDARAPLSFSLNQAAALCGVSAHKLWEWTTCGYVRAVGCGDRRRYDREALRQIAALRDAMRAGNPGSGEAEPPVRRSEEFELPSTPMDNDHLTLQAEMYFALNSGAAVSAPSLATHFGVSTEQMTTVLDAMVQTRHLARTRQDGDSMYRAARTNLHGPSVREQRIRATRRTRVPSRES